MSPEAEEVIRISVDAFSDAITIASLIEILEVGNMPASVASVNERDAGKAAQWVVASLFVHLHVVASRAYSLVRSDDLHAQKAFDLLSIETVRKEIEARHRVDDLRQAISLWQECRADARLAPFLKYRNKQIAHWAEFDESERPIINDVFAVCRNTAHALEKLANGTGVVGLDLKSQTHFLTDEAIRFWQAKRAPSHSGSFADYRPR